MAETDLGKIVESYWKFDQLLFDWLKNKTGSTFTFTQFITLHFLKTRGPQALKHIAYYLSITPASTSTMIKKMKKEGFISVMESPADKRIHLIQITPGGQKRLNSILELMEEFFEKFIPKNQRQAYLNIITSALDNKKTNSKTI